MAVLATGAVTEEALAGRPDELEREGFSEAARDGAVTEARGAAREDLKPSASARRLVCRNEDVEPDLSSSASARRLR
jgi:hypothetical protein